MISINFKKIVLYSILCITSKSIYCKIDQQAITKLKQLAQYAYSTFPTICNTYELANEILKNNIEGDFVECGVAAGAQIGAMAYACQRLNIFRSIHLFDSFEGIPLAGPNDDQQPGIGKITHSTQVNNINSLLVTSGVSAHSLEQVQKNIRNWGFDINRMFFYKGWFQNTLPNATNKIKKISLLRLDGDLYESTKVCLEYLYNKISKGGYIIIDDYALTGCKKAVHEFLTKNNLSPKIIEIEGGLGPVYWQVQ